MNNIQTYVTDTSTYMKISKSSNFHFIGTRDAYAGLEIWENDSTFSDIANRSCYFSKAYNELASDKIHFKHNKIEYNTNNFAVKTRITIADDAVYSFNNLIVSSGILQVFGGSRSRSTFISFGTVARWAYKMFTEINNHGEQILTYQDTTLNGTTGTDGKLNISTTLNTLQIENRCGSTITILVNMDIDGNLTSFTL